eukprot:11376097-Alexandrium_andersonii.AAC.1
MAENDGALREARASEHTRVMVEVEAEVAELVESRPDLQLIWTSSGYNKVRCLASGQLLPVTMTAIEQYIYGARYTTLCANMFSLQADGRPFPMSRSPPPEFPRR